MNPTVCTILLLLASVLVIDFIWLIARAAQLVTLKATSVQLKIVLVRLDDAVFTAVRDTQQLLVDRLKAASPDGSLTPDLRIQAKHAAITAARSQLGVSGLAQVKNALRLPDPDVDKMLSTRIEAAVLDLNARRYAWLDPGSAGDAVPFAG
jgi:hypothetical protein